MADDPKPTEPQETPKEEPKPEGVPVDQVTDLVGQFKDMLKEAASRPAAGPAGPTPEEEAARRARLLEEFESVKEAANEKAATGDVAGAITDMYQGLLNMNQQAAPNPEADPTVKTQINTAKRLARAENKEMFDKWGAEIEAEVANLPVHERLDADNWERAIKVVRANHVDEIIEERIKSKKDAEESETTIMAPGSRGSREDEHIYLDDDDLAMAQVFGKDEEGYTEVLKSYKDAQTGRGSMGVSLVPDGPVEKGKF